MTGVSLAQTTCRHVPVPFLDFDVDEKVGVSAVPERQHAWRRQSLEQDPAQEMTTGWRELRSLAVTLHLSGASSAFLPHLLLISTPSTNLPEAHMAIRISYLHDDGEITAARTYSQISGRRDSSGGSRADLNCFLSVAGSDESRDERLGQMETLASRGGCGSKDETATRVSSGIQSRIHPSRGERVEGEGRRVPPAVLGCLLSSSSRSWILVQSVPSKTILSPHPAKP